jgi:hypothetical protein
LDQFIFPLVQLQLKVVEDRSETGKVDEAATAFVFVLEKRLDQQSVVFHVHSKSLQCLIELSFFIRVEDIFWIKN